MKNEDIERVITENVTPKNRKSDNDCGICAFYNLADVCKRITCTTSDNVFSVYWVANKHDGFGKPVIDKECINRIACESVERVRMVSRAILAKQIEKKDSK